METFLNDPTTEIIISSKKMFNFDLAPSPQCLLISVQYWMKSSLLWYALHTLWRIVHDQLLQLFTHILVKFTFLSLSHIHCSLFCSKRFFLFVLTPSFYLTLAFQPVCSVAFILDHLRLKENMNFTYFISFFMHSRVLRACITSSSSSVIVFENFSIDLKRLG